MSACVQNIVFFRFDSWAKMSWEYMNLGPGNPGNVMGFCFPQDLITLTIVSMSVRSTCIYYNIAFPFLMEWSSK